MRPKDGRHPRDSPRSGRSWDARTARCGCMGARVRGYGRSTSRTPRATGVRNSTRSPAHPFTRSIPRGRRLFAVALLITAVCLTAAGCVEEHRQATDGRVEVVYWHMWTGEWQEVVDRVVRRFNASQDRIRVRALVVPDRDASTKLLLSVVGGEPPDLMTQWNQVIPAWAHKHALVPLDTLMESGEYEEFHRWLYPAARQIGTYEGHFYGLSLSLNAFGLLMNARMMREAGLDPDRPPRTTDELVEYAHRMFKDDRRGKLDRVGFMFKQMDIQQWATVFGGEFYDPERRKITANDPRIVQALEWMLDYSRQYDVNKLVSFEAGLAQTIGATYPFIGQKFAMLVDGQWRVEDMRKFAPEMEYRAAPIPYPTGGREKACWMNGNFMVIPRGAKHPREALEFAKYWAGWKHPEVGAEIATWGGWIPCAPALTKMLVYEEYLRQNPHFRTFLDVAASPNVRVTPVIPVQAFYWDRLKAGEEAAMRLRMSPQAALDQVTRETQAELDRVLARE
jgi:multiple sugar transport system substrate-binding protein